MEFLYIVWVIGNGIWGMVLQEWTLNLPVVAVGGEFKSNKSNKAPLPETGGGAWGVSKTPPRRSRRAASWDGLF